MSVFFQSPDTDANHFSIEEDASNISPSNLNHPFSPLRFHASKSKNDDILKNSFWYGKQMNAKDAWQFPK